MHHPSFELLLFTALFFSLLGFLLGLAARCRSNRRANMEGYKEAIRHLRGNQI